MKDAFDREEQANSRCAKIIAGVERLSTLFRAALQEQSNRLGLSSLQIQIILFIAHHSIEHCNTSSVSQEFAVTKPTVSDAVRVLIEKKLLLKKQDKQDARAFNLQLSAKGKKLLTSLSSLTGYFSETMDNMREEEIDNAWNGVLLLMQQLQSKGAVPMRMCFSCQHFGKDNPEGKPYYCQLMRQPLELRDIRVDCPEYTHI